MAQRIVGLDIGTSAVRAVELTLSDGSRPVLVAYGQVGIPPGSVVDGEVRDRTTVTAAIQRVWHEGGFSEKRVIIGIAGLRAITREIDMPVLPPEELDNAVRFQADEVVPFPLDQTAISAKVIAQYNDADGNPTLRVLVAAAHSDLINSVVAVTTAAGLQPVGIDLNTAALVRALYDPTFTGGPEAIISVGAGLTMVVVHEAGTLQFVRTIDLGGESISAAIGGALDLPLADAELVKRRIGGPTPVDPRATSAAETAINDLVGEIQNSIRFFASLPGRSPVVRCIVTGSGAAMPGFIDRLAGVGIPVQLADPLSLVDASGLGFTPEQAAIVNPTLAVSVGLALPDRQGRPFNLLPKEVTAKAAERTVLRYALGFAAAVVLILVGLTVLRVMQVNNAKSEVKTLAADNYQIQNVEIPKYAPVVKLQSAVVAQRKALTPILYSEIDWLVVLNQLGDFTPPTPIYAGQATWSSLSLSNTTTIGSITTIPGSTDIMGSVSGQAQVIGVPGAANIVDSFNSSPAFTDVTLSGNVSPAAGTQIAQIALTMSILGTTHSHRLSLVDQPIP